ncbi:MAG: DUF1343 domain-containing protein [Pirellulales bacterium]
MLLHSLYSRSVAFFVGIIIPLASVALGQLPIVAPEEVGFDPVGLRRIEEIVSEGIREAKMPGCVVCFGRQGKIAWLKAYGSKEVEPNQVPMTTDTVFDMASITKPMATATSMMKLVEQGKVRLGDKVSSIIPEFAANEKEPITIYDLLTHQSGLIADNALADYNDGPQEAIKKICNLSLTAPIGTKFIYSDVNFILLGELIHRISGKTVHEFSRDEIYQPLGMKNTGYLPNAELRARSAPTEKRNDAWMRGEVHDPRAYKLGGVAGHAGLFSTAEDTAIYAQMMLQNGQFQDRRVLGAQTVAKMTQAYTVPGGRRGLGWDKRTGYSTNKGDLLSDRAFGHGGFTGTVLWIDPELDLFYIFLSNRVHPNGKGLVNPLAGKIANVIASSLIQPKPSAKAAAEVLNGLDVLERDGYRQLAGRNVGLITNHTGRNRSGASIVELMAQQKQFSLKALFSPEHGFEGKLDIAKINDSVDSKTGLKIHSLYGQTRRPTREMLEGIDTLVFDIQDIGCRYYTYPSTMAEAMRAAAEFKVKMVVLDRPNPINGIDVMGPMLDEKSESFVGIHRIPIRHAMTTGELARMFQKEMKIEVDLQVIACEGWNRADYWDATGLLWTNPSPNMRNLTEAVLYPGVGMIEYTNVSVGRGTDTPFEVLGAPWLNGVEFAQAMNARRIPGVRFVPIEFTPTTSKFEKQLCKGVNIVIVDRRVLEPVRLGLEIAIQLRKQHPNEWEPKQMIKLLGNKAVDDAIIGGKEIDEVLALARQGVSDYMKRRAEFLLYE